MSYKRYKRGYFMPPEQCLEWSKKEYIAKPPIWCSVDLRDGNQALITPMSLEEKIEFFKLLVRIGFKEIEVGFPAASQTEYKFLRILIEQNLIPEDVSVQVLTQAREHIIKKTYEALSGCKNAIVHVYNSTSFAQRQQVFKKSRQEVKEIAIQGARYLVEFAKNTEGNFRFEYSPESFSGTEMEYALEVSNAVIDVFQPTQDRKLILNLPATVEMSLPHVYASQVEYMSKNIHERENVLISLHPHNDRGCAVADAELGILAGADRIEGTLFGNGERTGNVDIVALALNMHTHGVDSGLDFSNIPKICEVYERVTKMNVYERAPYAGKLVFAAFSGSHQDAIAKGMAYHKEQNLSTWSVPYLPIDPQDVGREYESDVIRINSQSGKGGIAYILHTYFGIDLPASFKEAFSYHVKDLSDKAHKELCASEICEIFQRDFVNLKTPLEILDYSFNKSQDSMSVELEVRLDSKYKNLCARGNGRLDSIANALRDNLGLEFEILDYSEHSLKEGSSSQAISYVQIKNSQGKFFGAGLDTDIVTASILGLLSAINQSLRSNNAQFEKACDNALEI
ncbi:MAG: 2-isopropylmalate synthase [Helicobacter sp.]|uniref:2-isopropylmalate synthase n=1 Tax=Helicobacter sp. 10-6591 TaxID=2004998 RepID=UPI000DCB6B96|nr:2-isopropylmalate synthase [Helicobacter sp. 10-6591]MCI6218351.1 2-isopropylmalate synthase [Helicobacter sp.]MCI7484395.1 2-isopropylmalate synthase [Helicobacter sp.]MDD7567215.1 2-isopropylmalate synthase [Helicobacter sp.]MDY5740220.1 2-isopropylmalate synthase [Helicobacter sp.]RAX55895.1 2-isopropylmalate synthase [Helicobacter sp. 10-6591]